MVTQLVLTRNNDGGGNVWHTVEQDRFGVSMNCRNGDNGEVSKGPDDSVFSAVADTIIDMV